MVKLELIALVDDIITFGCIADLKDAISKKHSDFKRPAMDERASVNILNIINNKIIYYAKQILSPPTTILCFNIQQDAIQHLQNTFPQATIQTINQIENFSPEPQTIDLIVADFSHLVPAVCHEVLIKFNLGLTPKGLLVFATFDKEGAQNTGWINENDATSILNSIRLWHFSSFQEHIYKQNSKSMDCSVFIVSKDKIFRLLKRILRIDVEELPVAIHESKKKELPAEHKVEDEDEDDEEDDNNDELESPEIESSTENNEQSQEQTDNSESQQENLNDESVEESEQKYESVEAESAEQVEAVEKEPTENESDEQDSEPEEKDEKNFDPIESTELTNETEVELNPEIETDDAIENEKPEAEEKPEDSETDDIENENAKDEDNETEVAEIENEEAEVEEIEIEKSEPTEVADAEMDSKEDESEAAHEQTETLAKILEKQNEHLDEHVEKLTAHQQNSTNILLSLRNKNLSNAEKIAQLAKLKQYRAEQDYMLKQYQALQHIQKNIITQFLDQHQNNLKHPTIADKYHNLIKQHQENLDNHAEKLDEFNDLPGEQEE